MDDDKRLTGIDKKSSKFFNFFKITWPKLIITSALMIIILNLYTEEIFSLVERNNSSGFFVHKIYFIIIPAYIISSILESIFRLAYKRFSLS